MSNRDLISGVIWLGVGFLFFAGALRYKLMHLGAYGPGFYPFLMACILIALAAALVILSWRKRETPSTGADSAPKSLRKIVLVLLALFGYGLALPYVGFLLTTFILIVFLLRYIEPVRWGPVLVISFLTTASCYALFIRWLGVQMPRGILHF